MPTTADQIARERTMVDRGISRYVRSNETAMANGRVSETQSGRKILQGFVQAVGTELGNRINEVRLGRRAKALGYLKHCDPDVAAFIALSYLLNLNLMDSPQLVQGQAISIATNIEDELRFKKFEENNKAYYAAIMEDFKRKGTQSYRHKHRVLTFKANEMEDGWKSWPPEDKLMIGLYMIDLIMSETDLFERQSVQRRKGQGITIIMTGDTAKWLADDATHIANMMPPEYVPMIVPPLDWTGMFHGGYLTARVQSKFPFIKEGRKSDFAMVTRDIESGTANKVMEAVNRIQRTPWKINAKVLETMQHVFSHNLGVGIPSNEPIAIPEFMVNGKRIDCKPADMDPEIKAAFTEWCREAANLYTDERERRAKSIAFVRTLQMANADKDFDRIWFPYNLCFRGRGYASVSGLSPQGADGSKGLLEFADRQPIGNAQGPYWFAVHGANVYGEDHGNFDERVRWVHANSAAIESLGREPIGNLSFLRTADKPWQFLAFAVEWAAYIDSHKSPSFCTGLPIAMDGSCNGLQHYSALFRDSIGAGAVNLTPSITPQDIYNRVADVCSKHVECSTHCSERDFWRSVEINRKLAKKPVMTLPYGSTRLTCTDSIVDWLKDNEYCESALERQRLAQWLSPILWDSIGNVVVAARVGMKWLQDVARVISRDNQSVFYSSPLGLPISMRVVKYDPQRITTKLLGGMKLTVCQPTNDINPRKMTSGIAPNFIHSMDATHMFMTVLEAPKEFSWAMVHDSYATHACNCEAMRYHIRHAFKELYSDNFAVDLHSQLEANTGLELPVPPAIGDYNINDIMDARYFFG